MDGIAEIVKNYMSYCCLTGALKQQGPAVVLPLPPITQGYHTNHLLQKDRHYGNSLGTAYTH
jgi:hypothetical protein